MVDVPASNPGPQDEQLVSDLAVGGVFLTGGTTAGLSSVQTIVHQLQALAATTTDGIRLYVAADQEGGQVQALQGPGFDVIPSALALGEEDPTALQQSSERWGAQLAQAGVNLNLAPVMDVVPADVGVTNQPIGRYDREFGDDPATVATHGSAFITGMHAAGVSTTIKHFPGLGQASGNTDVSAGVIDNVTTTQDPDLATFGAGILSGTQFTMVSLATYTKIDPTRPAAFSPVVINTLLRSELHFRGLVISDDLGRAAQVQAIPPGERAIDFWNAGGDIVLTSSPASSLAPMVDAVVAEMQQDPMFRQLIDNDVQAVLQAKQSAGLLPCS
jgi:beta-N-acetylhexosaminidase